jgi:hypothetical protein
MISATDILRLASSTDDISKVKLLWHLHSFAVEKGGAARFNREVAEWFPENLKNLSLHGIGENLLKAGFEYLQGYGYGFHRGRDLRGILYGHMERSEHEARERIYLTNIGRAVWAQLDECLEEQMPVFIEGLQGRGKSETAKAWCDAHRGQARYTTLYGISTQREFFAALAESWGLSHVHANSPGHIRYRVQDVIIRAGLTVVIDEAHFALPERAQRGRPAIIDWINTALCNHGISVALLSTPQFGPRLSEFENDTTYNADQFKRRFARRWTKLDAHTSEKDLIALTRKALPSVGDRGVELAVNYAGTFDRDVSALFDLVKDANLRAKKAGRPVASFKDLRDAYTIDRIPNENALATAFPKKKPAAVKMQTDQPVAAELPESGSEDAPAPQLASSRKSGDVFTAGGTRRQQIEEIQTQLK